MTNCPSFPVSEVQREKLSKNKEYLWEILKKGSEKARKVAIETLKEVKIKTGLNYGEKY